MAYSLDLVTICFDEDIKLMQLQARSVRKFVSPDAIENYVIIVNHENPEACLKLLNERVLPELEGFPKPVKILTQSELIKDDYGLNGWRSQQALKLMISKKLSSDAYVLLDAKNHFVKPVDKKTFFPTPDSAYTCKYLPQSNLLKYFEISVKYFGLEVEDAAKDAMPATTPYVIYTQWVKDMIAFIEEKEGCSLEEFMLSRNTGVTEFFAYYGFLRSQDYPIEVRYIRQRRMVASLFTKYPEDPAAVLETIESLRQRHIKVFGLHRKRLNQLNDQHRALIMEIWRELELVTSREEAMEFLTAVPGDED